MEVKVKPIIASPGRPVRSAGGPGRISYELIKSLLSRQEGEKITYLDLEAGTRYVFHSRSELERATTDSYSLQNGFRKLAKVLLAFLGTSMIDWGRRARYKLLAYRIGQQIEGDFGHLLHIHGISPTIAYMSFPSLPIIWSEHSKGSVLRELHMLLNEPPKGDLANLLRRAYTKMLDESALITFPSLGAVQLFEEYTRWEVPKEKLRIVYNGIPDPLEQYSDLVTEQELEDAVVVTVAQHVPEKGLDLALEALVRSDRPWRWLIIGQQTPWTEKLKELVRRQSKIEVRLLGHLPHMDVVRVLAKSRVVLATQRVAIFDLAILEAMALSKPIIATKVGGNVEALGSTYPFLAENVDEIADALQRVYDDLDTAQEVGKRNRERFLDKFTIAAMIEAFGALYSYVVTQ